MYRNIFFILILYLGFAGCFNSMSPEEERKYQERYSKAQNAVSDWIKKYALYPESYEPLFFSEYSELMAKQHNEKIPDSELYIIKHSHRLLDKDSNLTTFTGFFLLEHDYSVNVIETTRSNSLGGSFPPDTEAWTSLYARPMNVQDSLDLVKKEQQLRKKLVRDLKAGIGRGDIYTENPDDLQVLDSLLDTLDRVW